MYKTVCFFPNSGRNGNYEHSDANLIYLIAKTCEKNKKKKTNAILFSFERVKAVTIPGWWN